MGAGCLSMVGCSRFWGVCLHLLSAGFLHVMACKSSCPLRGDADSAFCPAPRQIRSDGDFNRRYPCSEEGQTCPLPNQCAQGEVICVDGVGRCALTGAKDVGTACGVDGICDGLGHCTSCDNEGAPCRPTESCRRGRLRCDGGEALHCETIEASDPSLPCDHGECGAGDICVDNPSDPDLCTNAALGTPCSEGGFCDGTGACVRCGQGGEERSCDPGGSCYLGRVVCSSDGSPACLIGSSREVGDGCGKSGRCDLFGRCAGSCGDGYIDAYLGEICDDGNLVDGDGCSANCKRSDCGTREDTTLRFRRLRGVCYWRSFDSVSRDIAALRCEELGGHLIRWDGNPGISVGVYGLVSPTKSDSDSRVWIGLQWNVEHQQWQWDNGIAASDRELQWQTYDRLGHSSEKPSSRIEPNGTRNESCVEWGGRGFANGPHQKGNQLNDISCESSREFVCARPPSGVFREEQ